MQRDAYVHAVHRNTIRQGDAVTCSLHAAQGSPRKIVNGSTYVANHAARRVHIISPYVFVDFMTQSYGYTIADRCP
jgi:hypothetical protein